MKRKLAIASLLAVSISVGWISIANSAMYKIRATGSQVRIRSDAISWYECNRWPVRGWKCANSRFPVVKCWALRPPFTQRWECVGGFVLYKSGVLNMVKDAMGLHVPHKQCHYIFIWRNYPLTLLTSPPKFNCTQY